MNNKGFLRFSILLIFLFVFLLSNVYQVHSQVTGTVSGTVMNQGAPDGSALIRVFAADLSSQVGTIQVTNPNGEYAIDLEPGEYDVYARTEDGHTASERVTIMENIVTTLDFTF